MLHAINLGSLVLPAPEPLYGGLGIRPVEGEKPVEQ